MKQLKRWAQALKRDVMTLWFALKHPLTPWYARAFAAILTAYALSPIDLIPDFIPILGYLDDLIIVPAGVWVLLRMVPEQVLVDSRVQADEWFLQGKKNRSVSLDLRSFWQFGVLLLGPLTVLCSSDRKQ